MNPHSKYYFAAYTDKRVLVLDDDIRTCDVLCTSLKLEGLDAGFAVTIDEALRRIDDRHFDVLIVNDAFGDDYGFAFMREASNLDTMRGTSFILTQNTSDVERAVDAVKFGVADVLPKPLDIERLLGVVKRTISTDPNQRPARVAIVGLNKLTPRERTVLEMITNGRTNRETGLELGISPRTVEVHRARVMTKLGARNAFDLARIVLFGNSVSLR